MLTLALALCTIGPLASFPGNESHSPSVRENSDEFRPLLNDKALSAWTFGPGERGFEFKDGILEALESSSSSWMGTERNYENFRLRFEFQPDLWSEGALIIHAPNGGDLVDLGKAIRLTHHQGGAPYMWCGAITGAEPCVTQATYPTTRDEHDVAILQWNVIDVEMNFPMLIVRVNETIVQEIDVSNHPALSHRLPFGRVVLHALGTRYRIRNLEIQELKPQGHGFRSLLEDSELQTRFTIEGGARWTFENGVVQATGDGYLITKERFKDVEFFALIRTSERANGGVFFRWQSLVPPVRGFEVQIFNEPNVANPTGSLYSHVRASSLNAKDSEWFALHVKVFGREAESRVNGVLVAKGELPISDEGFIALQMHSSNRQIEFRDIFVRNLDQ